MKNRVQILFPYSYVYGLVSWIVLHMSGYSIIKQRRKHFYREIKTHYYDEDDDGILKIIFCRPKICLRYASGGDLRKPARWGGIVVEYELVADMWCSEETKGKEVGTGNEFGNRDAKSRQLKSSS